MRLCKQLDMTLAMMEGLQTCKNVNVPLPLGLQAMLEGAPSGSERGKLWQLFQELLAFLLKVCLAHATVSAWFALINMNGRMDLIVESTVQGR